MSFLLALLYWLAVLPIALVLGLAVEVVCVLASLTHDDHLKQLTGDQEQLQEMALQKWKAFINPLVFLPLSWLCLLFAGRIVSFALSLFVS